MPKDKDLDEIEINRLKLVPQIKESIIKVAEGKELPQYSDEALYRLIHRLGYYESQS